jgi:single-strand DNA-binding protein
MNLNNITIVGRLTADPIFHASEDGDKTKDHSMFRVAVNRAWDKTQADYFNCVAWDSLGRAVAQFCKKGKEVGVSGSIHIDTTKRPDGTWDARVEVLALHVSFGHDPVTQTQTAKAPVAKPQSPKAPSLPKQAWPNKQAPAAPTTPDLAALLKNPDIIALLTQMASSATKATPSKPAEEEDVMTFTADDYPV